MTITPPGAGFASFKCFISPVFHREVSQHNHCKQPNISGVCQYWITNILNFYS